MPRVPHRYVIPMDGIYARGNQGNLSHHAPIIRQSKSHDYTNVFIVGWRAKKVLLFIPLWIGLCHLLVVLSLVDNLREINFSEFERSKTAIDKIFKALNYNID